MDLLGGSLRQEALDEIVGGEIPVAGEAVEPVQFEVLLEMIEPHEALQGGEFHLSDVFKTQVIGDEGDDLRRVVVGEAQAAADLFCHFGADLDVAIETDAAVWARRRSESGRLADVMKQDAPGERERTPCFQLLDHH